MRRRALLAAVLLPAASYAEERVSLEGVWRGRLGKTGDGVALTFTIGNHGAGMLRIGYPGGDQHFPIRAASTRPDRIIIEASAVSGRFEGAAAMDGKLEGVWLQANARHPLTLNRTPA